MWRNVRILILLLVLLIVAVRQYDDRSRTTDWDATLRVAVIPIRADDSATATTFVGQLGPESFRSLETFLRQEASHYSVALQEPVRFTLAPPLLERPPVVPPDAGVLGSFMWSLRARYWAWRHGDVPGIPPNVRLFVIYHDPVRSPALAHSAGLQKGLFGIVNVFADTGMIGSNDVVIAHELLHTLGATDKYGLMNQQPLFPNGYAEPDRQPPLPQRYAELMGGRIPLTELESEIPESLQQVLIGPLTAAEIGWKKP